MYSTTLDLNISATQNKYLTDLLVVRNCELVMSKLG